MGPEGRLGGNRERSRGTRELAKKLRAAETLESFQDRMRASSETLEVIERQKVLRSLLRGVVVGDREITIRQSILTTEGSDSSNGKLTSNLPRYSPRPQSYLLYWGSIAKLLRTLGPQARFLPSGLSTHTAE